MLEIEYLLAFPTQFKSVKRNWLWLNSSNRLKSLPHGMKFNY